MNQKIFLFGCWNKNQCLEGETNDGMEEVFQLLSNEPPIYDFGILLGDNIYPHKVTQTKRKTKKKTFKKFLETNVNKYEEIKEISDTITNTKNLKNLHVILGNHDVEKDCVKRNQIRHFSSDNSIIYPKNTIFQTDTAVFLFLNTNNIGELLDFLNDFDPKIMDNRWLILCGHDPLFSYKPKNKKKKGKTKVRTFQKIDEIRHIFASISNINYPKMAYICADTHNYQLLEVGYTTETEQFMFPIIVVGTGGAKPDSLKDIEKNNFHFDDESSLYIEVLDSKIPYGFVDMEVTPQTLEIKYKRCGSENSASIFFDDKKREIFYSIDVVEGECDLPKPSCHIKSPERHFLEIC